MMIAKTEIGGRPCRKGIAPDSWVFLMITTVFFTVMAVAIIFFTLAAYGNEYSRTLIVTSKNIEGLGMVEGMVLYSALGDLDRSLLEIAADNTIVSSPDRARIDKSLLRRAMDIAMKARGTEIYTILFSAPSASFEISSVPRFCGDLDTDTVAYCEPGPECTPGRTTFRDPAVPKSLTCQFGGICCREEYNMGDRVYFPEVKSRLKGLETCFGTIDGKRTEGACEIQSCTPGRFEIENADTSQCHKILAAEGQKVIPLSASPKPFVCCSAFEQRRVREIVASSGRSQFSIPVSAPDPVSSGTGSLEITIE